MLVYVGHIAVRDDIGVEGELRKFLADTVKQVMRLQQILAGMFHSKFLQDCSGVRAETIDVSLQRFPRRVSIDISELDLGYVVERLARELAIAVIFPPPFSFMLCNSLADLISGWFQSAFQSAQQGKGENDFIVIGARNRVPHIICNIPNLVHIVEVGLLLNLFLWHGVLPFNHLLSLSASTYIILYLRYFSTTY